MAAEADEKTEAPTPRRRQEAEHRGDLLQSRELGTALVVAAGALWVWAAGPLFVGACQRLLAQGLNLGKADLANFDPERSLTSLLVPALLPVGALLGMTTLASAAGPALLGSLGFRSGAFAFKPDRINPVRGLRRIFGLNGLIELGKSLAKAVLLGSIGYWLLARHIHGLFGLAAMDPRSAAAATGSLLSAALTALAGGLLLIALTDVPVQIFQRNRRLRMSKQEVREDMKQAEGSPDVKRAIRQRRHEVLSGSARKAVREATVVLTNPTHFAVALRYDPAKDAAPSVVARGRGETAKSIKALASDADVPMLEYPQLTRAIYFTSRAGQTIAEDLFVAVATVLAFVFRLDQALAAGLDQPSVLVPDSKRFDENGTRLRS